MGGSEHRKPVAVEQLGGSLTSQSLLGGGRGHDVTQVSVHTHEDGVEGGLKWILWCPALSLSRLAWRTHRC